MLPDGDGDRSPHEPEEFDPNSLGPDAPSAPGTGSPADDVAPEVPSAPELDPSAADPDTARLFWSLVALFNVALLGLSIGPMIGVFLGDWDLGLRVFLVGLLTGGYGAIKYYRFREDDAAD
ncbi:DUF7322 domain-containing protein [Halomicrobium urmianum]|uniref:DUF7322 domain-containing protein n=1 Tax=Halomicrobium urmianum TaxID=1586233 RepID=UPI001CD99205|nr:hypothetical protein [Halomicrobium urmianum]